MEKKNDAPKIIIQLILGACVYYLFSFKYKDILINFLSLQVYYQLLVIIVITNSYTAKWIDDFRSFLCHNFMMKCSYKYKYKHHNKQRDALLVKSKSAKLSEQTRLMVEGLSDTDFELEADISRLFEEVNREKSKGK